MSCMPPFVWACRHVRPSLLFTVGRWACVCEDMTTYLRQIAGCCEDGYELFICIRLGSVLEILYVEDGVGLYGRPDYFLGWVWGRHYFTKGWIPVRFLPPWTCYLRPRSICAFCATASGYRYRYSVPIAWATFCSICRNLTPNTVAETL